MRHLSVRVPDEIMIWLERQAAARQRSVGFIVKEMVAQKMGPSAPTGGSSGTGVGPPARDVLTRSHEDVQGKYGPVCKHCRKRPTSRRPEVCDG